MVRPDPTLPGSDLVLQGLEDLDAGVESPEAMLVAEAAPRLRDLGLVVPRSPHRYPSHRLYELLAEIYGAAAHSRYNAYLRRMVGFCRAAASTSDRLAVAEPIQGAERSDAPAG